MITKRAFVFVRHGESEGNKRHLCQGQLNLPLTPNGRSQARDAAAHIRGVASIFRIFASPLDRAAETARIIAPFIPHTCLLYHDGLKERRWGVAEGKHNRILFEQEALEASPDFQEPSSIEGIEELSQLTARIRSTLNEILASHGDELPLIVGHGCFFRSLCHHILKTSISKIPNATPALCVPEENGWSVQWITRNGYELVA